MPEVSNLLTKGRDGFIWGKLRQVAKYYLYTMSRSNLVNGLAKEVPVADYTPWWKPAMLALDGVLGVLTAASLVLFLVNTYGKKRRKNDEKSA